MISSYQLAGQIMIAPAVMYMETTYPAQRPIAIKVSIDPKKKTVSWDDTGRGHAVKFESYSIGDRKVQVISEDGSVWTFVPLTVEIFNRIKNQLTHINKDFKSDEELIEYYTKTNFQ